MYNFKKNISSQMLGWGNKNNNLQLFSFTGNRSVTLLQKENLQVAEFLKNKK